MLPQHEEQDDMSVDEQPMGMVASVSQALADQIKPCASVSRALADVARRASR